MPRRPRNEPAGEQPPEDLPEVDPAAGDASEAEDERSPLEPRNTALWSPQFLDGLPTDPDPAVRRTLEVLRKDYSIERESVPDPHPDFIAELVKRLPRVPSAKRIPELVVYDLAVPGATATVPAHPALWKTLAQRAIEERLMLRISDCYELLLEGTGRFGEQNRKAVLQGLVIGFERIAHLPEISPMTLAKRTLMDLLGGTCQCTRRVTPGQRAAARIKCRRDHLLKRWRSTGAWLGRTLWQFLDQATLGFCWESEQSRRVSFRNGAFHSSMLAFLLDRFVAKANVVQRWCPRCHDSFSVPCDQTDCLLKTEPLDALPFRGRPDWLVLRALGKCSECGGILTEDELGRPCPGRPTGGAEEACPCGSLDFEPAHEWFHELPLWKCRACSELSKQDRFFLAKRCVQKCPTDGKHDQCPGIAAIRRRRPVRCSTRHARGAGFRLCYWLFYLQPGLSPDELPPAPGEGGEDVQHGGNEDELRQDPDSGDQDAGTTEEAGLVANGGCRAKADSLPGQGVQAGSDTPADQDENHPAAEESRITEQEGQAILAAAIEKASGKFRGYIGAMCRVLVRDLRSTSQATRRRAVRFMFAAAAKGSAAYQPSDADYRALHAELARPRRPSDLPTTPSALRIAWTDGGHGALVANRVRWHLDSIRLLLEWAAAQSGWRRLAVLRLASDLRRAEAILLVPATGPRPRRATEQAAEEAFAWLHCALAKGDRSPDLPATPEALRRAWKLEVAPAMRDALSHYRDMQGVIRAAPRSASRASPGKPGPS